MKKKNNNNNNNNNPFEDSEISLRGLGAPRALRGYWTRIPARSCLARADKKKFGGPRDASSALFRSTLAAWGSADAPKLEFGGQTGSIFEVCWRSCTFGAKFVRTQQNIVIKKLNGFNTFSDGFGSFSDGFGSFADGFGSFSHRFGPFRIEKNRENETETNTNEKTTKKRTKQPKKFVKNIFC